MPRRDPCVQKELSHSEAREFHTSVLVTLTQICNFSPVWSRFP